MRQVGSESAVSDSACNRMAIDASGSLENLSTRSHFRVVFGDLLLMGYPPVKVLTCVHINSQQHLGVLSTAVRSALSKEHSGPFRFNPHRIHFIGDEIDFAHQP